MKRLWKRMHEEDETSKQLRRAIDDARKTIAFSFEDVQKKMGEIPAMPTEPGGWTQIAEGWRAKLMSEVQCADCDVYHVNATAGHTLVLHRHPQSETIHIVTGRIRCVASNRVYDSHSEPVHVPPHLLHGYEAVTDCTLVIKFHPPLGVPA